MRPICFTSISDSLSFWALLVIITLTLFPAYFDHFLNISNDVTTLLFYVEGFLSGFVLRQLLARLDTEAKEKE